MRKMTDEMRAGGILEEIYTTLARLGLYSNKVSEIVKRHLVAELVHDSERMMAPVIQAYVDYIEVLPVGEHSDYVHMQKEK